MAAQEHRDRIEYLEGEFAKAPDSYLFLPLARAYLEDGRLEEAEEICMEGVERHPGYTSARALQGLIHYHLNDFQKSEEDFRRVIEEDAGNLLARRMLGRIYSEAGEIERSAEEYRKALAIRPGDAESARALAGLGVPREGSSAVQGEKERRGERIYTRALAEIYMREGAFEEALDLFSWLVKNEPWDEQLREKVEELNSLLRLKPSSDLEGESPGASPGVNKPIAFKEHMNRLEAELEQMRRRNQGLTDDEVHRAIENLEGWLRVMAE